MHDTEIRSLRRFCCLSSLALVAILAACIGAILFAPSLPVGAALLVLLLLVVAYALQHLVSVRLKNYLDTGGRYYLKRLGVCACILVPALVLAHAGKLTPDLTLLLILAAYTLLPLLDILHALRRIHRA